PRRVDPTPSGPRPRRAPPPALATTTDGREDDPRPAPGRFRPPTATHRQPNQPTETLPTRSRTPARPKITTRAPLPSGQKDQHQTPPKGETTLNAKLRAC